MRFETSDKAVTETKYAGSKNHDVLKPGTLVEKAHAALKKNIIAGVHRPGEKLRVEHLKQEYGVSSGTLREALTKLIADKLVVAEGQRGFRVERVSVEDLVDLSRIRILLEKDAIRQSIIHGDEEWEAGVVSSFHLLRRATRAFAENLENDAILDEWESKHRDFHLSLIAAAPSQWTRYFLTVSYQQYERYRHMFVAMAEEFYKNRDAAAEHVAILDAVLARDADTAEKMIEDHLTQSIDEWVSYFEKIGALETSRAAVSASKPGVNARKDKA